LTYYALERLLSRIASGTTTERDADELRRFLLALSITATVVTLSPAR
jgi:hypothetical protein